MRFFCNFVHPSFDSLIKVSVEKVSVFQENISQGCFKTWHFHWKKIKRLLASRRDEIELTSFTFHFLFRLEVLSSFKERKDGQHPVSLTKTPWELELGKFETNFFCVKSVVKLWSKWMSVKKKNTNSNCFFLSFRTTVELNWHENLIYKLFADTIQTI